MFPGLRTAISAPTVAYAAAHTENTMSWPTGAVRPAFERWLITFSSNPAAIAVAATHHTTRAPRATCREFSTVPGYPCEVTRPLRESSQVVARGVDPRSNALAVALARSGTWRLGSASGHVAPNEQRQGDDQEYDQDRPEHGLPPFRLCGEAVSDSFSLSDSLAEFLDRLVGGSFDHGFAFMDAGFHVFG